MREAMPRRRSLAFAAPRTPFLVRGLPIDVRTPARAYPFFGRVADTLYSEVLTANVDS